MISFKECQTIGYKARTMENAGGAAVTIAIAKDFTTAGERCTAKCVALSRKLYIPVNYDELGLGAIHIRAVATKVAPLIRHLPVTINIAGNGIYTLKDSQEEINTRVYYLLDKLFYQLDFKITSVRSGGQTGIDEAGLNAASKLGIPAFCLAPKGWVFRNRNGKDIANEELFKARFESY